MTARRLSLTNKKVRGVSRRLRTLTRWAESFAEYFPAGLSAEERYWNVKIPVLSSLIQGRQTSREIQTYCTQQLIFAAHNIFRAKPEDMTDVRVTCCVIRPDMFSSELCIFTDDDYFNEHTSNGRSRFGESMGSVSIDSTPASSRRAHPPAVRRMKYQYGVLP